MITVHIRPWLGSQKRALDHLSTVKPVPTLSEKVLQYSLKHDTESKSFLTATEILH